MDVQQTNLLKSSPNHHTALINYQENLPVGSSFDEKKDSSDIHQRSFNSNQEALNPGPLPLENSQGWIRYQRGELSPSFERYYRTLTIISFFISVAGLLWTLLTFTSVSKLTFLDCFIFAISLSSILQSVYAHQGFTKKDSDDMENALTWTLISLMFLGYFLVFEIASDFRESREKETRFGLDYGRLISRVLIMCLYALLFFFPTRKVRDLFKPTPQELQERARRFAETLSVEQLRDLPFLEQLNSTTFILWKYVHLVLACLGVKCLIFWVFEGLSSEERILEKMMSEWSFFVFTIKTYLITILIISYSFFAFEGIRRKNLKKIESSTKLFKIFTVSWVLLNLLEAIALENGQVVWKYKADNFMGHWTSFFAFIFLFFFGVFKAQDILRSHEKFMRSV